MSTVVKNNETKAKFENKEVIYIEPETIMPNRAQPRTYFDSEGLNELAESISRYGILQPLTVRRVQDSCKYSHFRYELIAGERRLRAAKLLNLEKVPCILMESDAKTSAALAIIENLHRRDLNVFEEASAIASLIDIYKLTQEQVAAKLSMTQAAVANKLRLLRLSSEEQQLILKNNLTERHARALLRLKDAEKRKKVLQKIIENSLNVKQTEECIEKMLPQPTQDITADTASNERIPTETTAKQRKNLIKSITNAIARHRADGANIKTRQTETDSEIIITVAISKQP